MLETEQRDQLVREAGEDPEEEQVSPMGVHFDDDEKQCAD